MAKNNTNDRVDQIDRFHKTRKGRLSFGFIELAVAYVFVSLAIDSGSVWEYLAAAEQAKQAIEQITAVPEVNKTYLGTVQRLADFGAFVEILPGKEGLVHISEMSEKRLNSPNEVVKEGDKVTVKLIGIDERGRLQLSMKAAKKDGEK